jgi:hypothetical protein
MERQIEDRGRRRKVVKRMREDERGGVEFVVSSSKEKGET